MFEWLLLQNTGDLVVLGTGVATIVGSAAIAWRGIVKGRPSSTSPHQELVRPETRADQKSAEALERIAEALDQMQDHTKTIVLHLGEMKQSRR